MNILLVAIMALALLGIVSGIVIVLVKTLKAKKLTHRKIVTIALIIFILIGGGFLSRRVFILGPNVTRTVDLITKETRFDEITSRFTLDSIFGQASITNDCIDLSKFSYADVAFKSSEFSIEKIVERPFVNSIYVYGKVSYADSQKLLKHLAATYGLPYQVKSEDLENGFIHYENFAEQIVKETTCIYSLDVTAPIDNFTDLEHIFRSGNYIILDLVEENKFGAKYYTCQIDWCFTNNVRWGNRIRTEDNPNIMYLSKFTGYDD